MRKHIVIVSEESVFSGHYHCGIGEVVDTMASALRKYYDVTVITIGNRKGGKVRGTITLGVEGDAFVEAAADCVNGLAPDLVHNFGRPDLISRLTVDCPKVMTFDRWETDMEGYTDYAPMYDHITTVSTAYANEVMAAHPAAAQWPVKGIINGIDGGYYSLVKADRKAVYRADLYRALDREDTGKTLVVWMGRLNAYKGIDRLLDDAQAIAETGADLMIWGTGEAEYEQRLTALHDAGVLIYTKRMCDYFDMMTALYAADFYLMPSESEPCGLQPMKAARVGCVPIVTTVGGLGENFNTRNAVIIGDSIADAVRQAVNLTGEEYAALRQNCLDGDWTWDTRILPWVELYGLPTAPKEAVVANNAAATVALDEEEPAATERSCPFARKETAV